MLQTLIFHQEIVSDHALDQLQANLPVIIADVLTVPGGNLALLEAQQISLHFIQASRRDVGKNINLLIYASLNEPRKAGKTDRATKIRDAIVTLIDNDYTVDVRLYLQEIGAARDAAAGQAGAGEEE